MERRELSTIVDYCDLLVAMRRRKAELQISDIELAEAAELTPTYVSKVLLPPPASMKLGKSRANWRMLGPRSFGGLLSALGLALVVVEDPVAARAAKELPKRAEHYVTRGLRPIARIGFFNAENAREMGARRWDGLDEAQRRRIARRAAKARWRKARAAAAGTAPAAA
jgi:hypothetical protein